MEEDRAFVREALEAGAKGYVQKQAAGKELVRAIREAVRGGGPPEPSWAQPRRQTPEF